MTIFTYQNLYRAYLECRRTKRNTVNALKFEENVEENIFNLLSELKNGTYRTGRSICFVVTEPCPREIFAADFRDRIVYHLLVREIMKIGERRFIYDSYACRKDKGTHRAVGRLQSFIKTASENNKKELYFLQLDVKSFFMTINHSILFSIIKKKVRKQKRDNLWKEEVLELSRIIIFHKAQDFYIKKGKKETFDLIPEHKSLFSQKEGRGLPIGNYSSQFFANLYLNELDNFVKRELKQKYYIRYVDDFLILGEDEVGLKNLIEIIDRFLNNNLDLKLNYAKIKLMNVRKGISFLGYFVKPTCLLFRKRVVNSFQKKMKDLTDKNEKIKLINAYKGVFEPGRINGFC